MKNTVIKMISVIAVGLLPAFNLIQGYHTGRGGLVFLVALVASLSAYRLIKSDLLSAIYTGYLIAIMFFGIILYL